jgi:hypothetical protein
VEEEAAFTLLGLLALAAQVAVVMGVLLLQIQTVLLEPQTLVAVAVLQTITALVVLVVLEW